VLFHGSHARLFSQAQCSAYTTTTRSCISRSRGRRMLHGNVTLASKRLAGQSTGIAVSVERIWGHLVVALRIHVPYREMVSRVDWRTQTRKLSHPQTGTSSRDFLESNRGKDPVARGCSGYQLPAPGLRAAAARREDKTTGRCLNQPAVLVRAAAGNDCRARSSQ